MSNDEIARRLQSAERKNGQLQTRVSRIETDLAGIFRALTTMKGELERQSTNADTFASGLYAAGENFQRLGQAVTELQRAIAQATGLPIMPRPTGRAN